MRYIGYCRDCVLSRIQAMVSTECRQNSLFRKGYCPSVAHLQRITYHQGGIKDTTDPGTINQCRANQFEHHLY